MRISRGAEKWRFGKSGAQEKRKRKKTTQRRKQSSFAQESVTRDIQKAITLPSNNAGSC